MERSHTKRYSLTLLLFALALAGRTSNSHAQVNTECFTQLSFLGNPPGARALALGEAFVAVAVDATASLANPAGLTTLLYPQVSVQFHHIEYGEPDPGDYPDGEIHSNGGFADQLGFASVAVPLGQRVTVSSFYHNLNNYDRNFDYVSLAEQSSWSESRLECKTDEFGASAGLEIRPNFSIGAALGLATLSIGVNSERHAPDSIQTMATNDPDVPYGWSATIGVLYRPSASVTIGAAYQRRPKFDEVPYNLSGAPNPGTPATTLAKSMPLRFPDSFSLGVAVRPSDVFVMSGEVTYTFYSQISESFRTPFVGGAGTAPDPSDFKAEDGPSAGVGAEYIHFIGETPVAIRGGLRAAKSGAVHYGGSDSSFVATWPTGDVVTTFRYSVGLGTVLLGSVQLDGAYSWGIGGEAKTAAPPDYMILSLVYMFGG